MAAVLACGERAVLSHASAAALWGVRRPRRSSLIDVSVPRPGDACHDGIRVHRRRSLRPEDVTTRRGIPVTTPACTIVDVAQGLSSQALERVVNEADKLDLVHPEALREYAHDLRRPGAGRVRRLLDETTFSLTDSVLEQRFLEIAKAAGLPKPETQALVQGHRVDFDWPDLGLVVETDGARFHRTALEQTADRRRDQALTAAGLTVLRFTHAQVRFGAREVEATLARTATALGAAPAARGARTPPESPPGRAACA